MYEKDFNGWIDLKKRLHGRADATYAHERDVWWCALGANVGSEIDGKNDNFERPVLILRAYNKDMLLIVPMTGKERHEAFYRRVLVGSTANWIALTQIRVISNKRLLRKVGILAEDQYLLVKKSLQAFL